MTGHIPVRTLQPGEATVVHTRTCLKTLLGSCAGLTFRVERLGLGAMCHAMLPSYHQNLGVRDIPKLRYVDYAVREVIHRLEREGATRDEIEIKLFGCCDVLEFAAGKATVGRLNAESAVRVLGEEGIHLTAQQVGGRQGMYIMFDTGTGEVLMRRLEKPQPIVFHGGSFHGA